MKKWKQAKNIIEFVDTSQHIHKDFYPVPAIREIPDWYKNTESYLGSKYVTFEEQNEHVTNATIKKCLPVFDTMTAGYILKSHYDLIIRWQDGEPSYQWPNAEGISFQAISQAQNYPGQEKRSYAYPKFNHPWSIRTPKGYSCFITTPMHRDLPFELLEGIVDTDSFNAPIFFPFVLKEERWQGIIEAGTPIAQIIPFKRESWNMQVSDDEQKIQEARLVRSRIFSSYINSYKKAFWQRKNWN